MFRKTIVTPSSANENITKKNKTSDKILDLKRCFTIYEVKTLASLLSKLALKGCYNEDRELVPSGNSPVTGSDIVDILVHAIKQQNYVQGFEFLPDILKKADIHDIPNQLILYAPRHLNPTEENTEAAHPHEFESMNDEIDRNEDLPDSIKEVMNIQESVSNKKRKYVKKPINLEQKRVSPRSNKWFIP